ncbi:MAG: LCP family protein, partial [Erysipelotrichia bacterium]|nr:LCP family protein [Erysipelotrichia bacterium]
KDAIEFNVEDQQEKKINKKRRYKKPHIVVYIISVLIMLATIYLSYRTYSLVSSYTFLPAKYIKLCLYGLGGFCLFFGIIAFLPNITNLNKILQSIICAILSVVLIIANTYLPSIKGQLERTFTPIPDEGQLMINVYVLKDSGYEKITDLEGKTIGVQTELDQEYQEYAVKVINREFEGEGVITKDYPDIYTLTEALYNKEVDAIMINETYVSIISENADFLDFKTDTLTVYTCVQQIKLDFNTTDIGNITTQPFVVLVGGNDTWVNKMAEDTGDIGRTDVQMLVVVNPNTKQVLIITIPRDSYVPLFGNYNCMDKLTHASIYGYDAWIKTVSRFLDVDINYFLRINFASLVNIVDAIGGIDVDNPYYFESEYCMYWDENDQKAYNYLQKFEQGLIHLDGPGALGYSRERYYIKEDGTNIGDVGRNMHQAIVLKAMIKKLTTVETITHIDDLFKAIDGTFVTNISTDQIYALVQMQLDDMATWNIVQYSLSGYGSYETSYAMGQSSGQTYSVMIVDQSMLNAARQYIKQMLNNEIVTIE